MGKLVKGVNDLYTWCMNNGEYGQQLINEWVGEDENGNKFEMDKVSRGSHIKAKWKCSNNHEWVADIHSRTGTKSGCPYCYNERRSRVITTSKLSIGGNDLYTWCKNNDEFGQQLINEWVGEDEQGNKISMNETAKASNKKVKWKCSKCNKEWTATIASRTNVKSECPFCNKRGTSYPEQYLYHALKQLYPKAENRCRVLKSQEHPKGIEFDIGIPEIPLCIEYSPTNWHNGKEEYDDYKKHICETHNVRLIQIIDDRYDELEHKFEDDYICLKVNYTMQTETMQMILEHILKTLKRSINEIDLNKVEKDTRKALELKGVQQGVNDLKTWCKNNDEFGLQLLSEWVGCDENGNKVEIDEVSMGSGRKFKWKCSKGHEWTATINKRTSVKRGCPYCYKENRVTNQNSLATWCKTHGEYGQKLMEKWVGLDKDNNPISMNEVSYGSTKCIQWKNKDGSIRCTPIYRKTYGR